MTRNFTRLSNEVIKQLDDLEVQRNLPRADLLRESGKINTVKSIAKQQSSVPGIWQGCEEDGVEYLRKLREKW